MSFKGVCVRLPAFKEMGHFTGRSQLIADTIRVDVNNFWGNLSSDYSIMRMNHLPHTCNSLRFLLPVHKATIDFRLSRQIFSFAKGFFSLLVIIIGISELKQARDRLCFRLTEE